MNGISATTPRLLPEYSLLHSHPGPKRSDVTVQIFLGLVFGKHPAKQISPSPCCQLLMTTHSQRASHMSDLWDHPHVVQTWTLEAREVLLGKYPMPETPSNFHQALSVAKSRDPLKVAPGKRQGGFPGALGQGPQCTDMGPKQPCIRVW